METYPTYTINRNVPKGVFLVYEESRCSGEIITTYYIDKDGNMFKVSDWVSDIPQPITLSKLCRLTLDTENMLLFRFKSHFVQSDNQ